VTDDEPSAISVAMTRLGLQSGVAFEARVAQLAQLVAAHKTVSLFMFNVSFESTSGSRENPVALPPKKSIVYLYWQLVQIVHTCSVYKKTLDNFDTVIWN
jgi:hypothetical protein